MPTSKNNDVTNEFDLIRTLRSGQCFRYQIEDNKIIVYNGKNIYTFKKKNQQWILPNDITTKKFLRLDAQHDASMRALRSDKILRPIIDEYKSIRVLRQDPHETIIAFIISANNNITRITRSMQSIAPNKLPEPGTALNEKELQEKGLGYRAAHLAITHTKITHSYLTKLKKADYKQAHKILQELPGVGPKVADCICLYGLDHTCAFPVDVHIYRAMQHLFPEEKFKNEKEAKTFAQQRWKKNAGIAQQMIFEWAKDNLGKRTKKRK